MIDPALSSLAPQSDSQATLHVDVIADLICPWCYLGKRRLDDALGAVHGPSVVSWYPFQLNPDMPADGMSLDGYLASKFDDPDSIAPALSHLTEMGNAEGIRFRFDRIRRVPNTLDAHRLMQLAEQQDQDTTALAEALMSAFFEHGDDISDRDVLVSIADTHGLYFRDVHHALDDARTRQIVMHQEGQVRKSGVTGVPDFLVNKRLFVTGAQSTDTLVKVFDRAMFGEESESPVSQIIH